jgi:hypothetical protein
MPNKPRNLSLSLSLACLLLGVLAHPSQAQLPVIDIADIGQNTITAVQTTVTAATVILMDIKMAEELLPLDEILILDDAFAQDMSDLSAIATEGMAVIGDLGALKAEVTALFDLSTAPATSTELAQRMSDIRQLVFQVRSYAIRAQAIIRTLQNTVTHMNALVAAIGDYVGGMQGRQSIMQNLAEVNKAQAALVASQTAFNNSKVIEKMDEPLMIESWLLIKQNVMSGY